MTSIHAETHEYNASHGGVLNGSEQGAKLLSNFMVAERLVLKTGAQARISHLKLSYCADTVSLGYAHQEHG